MTRRHRGFSLIELLVAVGIALAVVSIGVVWLNAERQRVARGDAIKAQAIEMATLGRALDQYLRDNAALVPEDAPMLVTPEVLAQAGLLPVDFAVRDRFGSTPASPLGQPYMLMARKIEGRVRGIALTASGPSPAALARLGIKGTAEEFDELQATVSRTIRQQHHLGSALVRAGEVNADRQVSTFAYDFTPFVETAVQAATVVALAGFPEFASTPDIRVTLDPDGEPGQGNGSSSCSVVAADRSCPAETSEVFAWDACDSRASEGPRSFNGSFGNVVIAPTPREFIEVHTINPAPNAPPSFNCAANYGVAPYLTRYGLHNSSAYGDEYQRISFTAAHTSSMYGYAKHPIAGHYVVSSTTMWRGSCTLPLTIPNNIYRATHSCAALEQSEDWDRAYYSLGDGQPPADQFNGLTLEGQRFPVPVGWRTGMSVKWNGSEIALTPACRYGLPVDRHNGPWSDPWWRTELGVSTSIPPVCPPAEHSYSGTYVDMAYTRVFNPPRAGGGKICCS